VIELNKYDNYFLTNEKVQKFLQIKIILNIFYRRKQIYFL